MSEYAQKAKNFKVIVIPNEIFVLFASPASFCFVCVDMFHSLSTWSMKAKRKTTTIMIATKIKLTMWHENRLQEKSLLLWTPYENVDIVIKKVLRIIAFEIKNKYFNETYFFIGLK